MGGRQTDEDGSKIEDTVLEVMKVIHLSADEGTKGHNGVGSANAPDLEANALEGDRFAPAGTSGAQRLVVERQAPRRRAVYQRVIKPQTGAAVPVQTQRQAR